MPALPSKHLKVDLTVRCSIGSSLRWDDITTNISSRCDIRHLERLTLRLYVNQRPPRATPEIRAKHRPIAFPRLRRFTFILMYGVQLYQHSSCPSDDDSQSTATDLTSLPFHFPVLEDLTIAMPEESSHHLSIASLLWMFSSITEAPFRMWRAGPPPNNTLKRLTLHNVALRGTYTKDDVHCITRWDSLSLFLAKLPGLETLRYFDSAFDLAMDEMDQAAERKKARLLWGRGVKTPPGDASSSESESDSDSDEEHDEPFAYSFLQCAPTASGPCHLLPNLKELSINRAWPEWSFENDCTLQNILDRDGSRLCPCSKIERHSLEYRGVRMSPTQWNFERL